MRTKHNYLSLKWHETDAAVKPEVFMASTHLFMPFEAEDFMDRLTLVFTKIYLLFILK